ncbi:hypothetical protein SAMN05444064_103140 [Pseudomonas syringae]|nr:hypothetical protein SAMN05444514_103140 [Pseudomonas syringae]SFL66838.1 hypothetical protein SAMN05444064_103140 [Pseudomonas syringae]
MLLIEPKEKKMNLKESLEDYTEQELIELMKKI